jgi:predicted small lipoprotein YifL
MRRALIAGAAGALVVAGVAACGGSGPSYFLASDKTAVVLVEWGPASGGSASGTITYDYPAGTAPDEWIGVINAPMTIRWHRGLRGLVSFQTSQVTISPISPRALRYVFGGSRIRGTLSGDTLTLHLLPGASPGLRSAHVLRAASSQQYNTAAVQLQTEVTNRNTTAANQQPAAQQAHQTAQHESALSHAVAALKNDVSTLTQEVTTVASDVKQADADLGTLKSDAAGGPGPSCDNAYTVNDDAQTVNDDGKNMSGDVLTVEVDMTDVKAGIRKVQAEVTAVHNDGGTVPRDVGITVSTAQAAVSGAPDTVNADVTSVNRYLHTAYTDASGNAGSCGGPVSPAQVNGIPS